MKKVKIGKLNIPEEVSCVTKSIQDAGFEAFLVGGCVRDLFMGKKPKDWDIATNAIPEQITSIFPKTVYENNFGTVAVINENVSDETTKIIEITPYRKENVYLDHRRPSSVEFTNDIFDDLKRRDFTINAMAYDPINDDFIDVFGGILDLNNRLIKCVNNPEDRFKEDSLRMMRAVRLHVEHNFDIENETMLAISKNSLLLGEISKERVRDEFVKIIMSDLPSLGIETLNKLNLLRFIAPELEKCIGIEQKGAHIYDVWTHLLKSLQHSADKKYPLEVRLAALFHDISKPETRRYNKNTNKYTFYGHEVVGSRVTTKILERLRFSRETIEKVKNLIRWHMFFSDTEKITHSAVRRMIVNIGKDNIWDLMNLRYCDRVGTGRPKEDPYRLRKYHAMIDEVMSDPVSVSMLAINGGEIMKILNIKPGPRVGWLLNALMEEVLDNPQSNTGDYLSDRIKKLNTLSDTELQKISKAGIGKKNIKEEIKIKEINKRHRVN